jgi:CrcB protein
MQIALYSYLVVAVGGAFGAMARYALNISLQSDAEFPWGTFAANLLGCLVMGFIAQLVSGNSWFNDAGVFPEHYRLLFAVGFCGSFTTLSSMMVELNTMLQKNELFYSFTYFAATMIGGFACFYIGIVCAKALMQLQSS